MHKLIIEDDEGKTTVVPLIRDEISIGRKEGNTIRLTERNVSRRHAKLLRQNGTVFIEDLASYNGIKVNGNKINGRVAVAEGDRIQIGDYVLGLKVEGSHDAETTQIKRPPTEGPSDAADDARTMVTALKTEPAAGAAVAEVARLVCVSSNFAGLEFSLNKPVTVIGRTDENDFVVNHRSISRHHARIVEDHGRHTIIDLQSANGVRVNGEEYGKVELRKGDLIDLGHVRLRFVAPGEDFVFSRDATVVDISKGKSPRNTVWVAAGLVAVVAVGILLWRVIGKDEEEASAGPRPTAATSSGQGGGDTTSGGGGDQTGLLSKLNSAMANRAWDEALGYCRKLSGSARTSAEDSCKRAAAEKSAKQLFDDANAAETKNEHKRAIELFHKIPKSSVYRAEAERSPAYSQAVKNYKAQASQALDELVRKGDCNGAAAKATEVKKVLPDAGGDVDAKVKACRPAVAHAKKPDDERPTKIALKRPHRRPHRKPEHAIKVKRVPVRSQPSTPTKPSGPTAAQKAAAKQNLSAAWAAYRSGYYQKALTLAKKTLAVEPRNKQALAVVGACACYLKRAKLAQSIYNRLDAQRRQLLRSVCSRTGVDLK